MKIFSGSVVHLLDQKGRVAVPQKYRAKLAAESEGRVFITPSFNAQFASLDVYPADAWEATIERVAEMDFDDDDEREAVFANYLHPAVEQTLDASGRLLITQEHREYAGLVKEVVFTGDNKKFRLWAPEEYAKYTAKARADKPKLKNNPKLKL